MEKIPKIVLAVTVSQSIKLFGRLPYLLNENGWEVHVVSGPGSESKEFGDSKVLHHELLMKREPSLLRDVIALFRWVDLMRKINPDVLFVGTPKASFLALLAGKLTRVPSRVYGLWGLRLETTAGLGRKVLAEFERAASAAATDVLAVSRSLADKYLEFRLCKSTKILVIGKGSSHGVDTERFTPAIFESTRPLAQKIGLAEGVPVLGFVGRFSRDKGADSLLATRMLLSEKNIDHELLVVGSVEGETDVLDKLNNFDRRIKHVGVVTDVERYFKLMDVLLLPTRREGFPNVVLEAAASGVPAVTTDATGAVDSVVNGVTGITVPLESSKYFSEAVFGLLCNPDSIKRLGSSARARAVADFGEAAVLSGIMEFLEKLPKRRLKRPRFDAASF